MEGLNPNKPPPKETVVRIEKWEYSDPIAVPHPDNVSLIVNVPAEISGPLSARVKWKRHQWSAPQILDQIKISDGPDGGRVLSAVIGMRKQIDHNPPSLLRSEVLLAGRIIKTLDLPIAVGD